MNAWIKGLLIIVLSVALAPFGLFLYSLTILKILAGHPGGLTGLLFPVIRFFEGGALLLITNSVLIAGGAFGLAYGLLSGILLIYDLSSPAGWLELVIDLTWSLPNTLFGFVVGNVVYLFFGAPSRDTSEDKGWISYQPRSSTGFGNDVLQTLGTVNIGGEGAHERVHLMQARLFGPLYLLIFGANYIVNFIVQGIWSGTVGLLLWFAHVRDTPYFRPPDTSAVKGFFGWIYYATVFELWAYATQ